MLPAHISTEIETLQSVLQETRELRQRSQELRSAAQDARQKALAVVHQSAEFRMLLARKHRRPA